MLFSYLLTGLAALLLALSVGVAVYYRDRMTYRLLKRGFFCSIGAYVAAGLAMMAQLAFTDNRVLPLSYMVPLMVVAAVIQIGYILLNTQVQWGFPDRPNRLRMRIG